MKINPIAATIATHEELRLRAVTEGPFLYFNHAPSFTPTMEEIASQSPDRRIPLHPIQGSPYFTDGTSDFMFGPDHFDKLYFKVKVKTWDQLVEEYKDTASALSRSVFGNDSVGPHPTFNSDMEEFISHNYPNREVEIRCRPSDWEDGCLKEIATLHVGRSSWHFAPWMFVSEEEPQPVNRGTEPRPDVIYALLTEDEKLYLKNCEQVQIGRLSGDGVVDWSGPQPVALLNWQAHTALYREYKGNPRIKELKDEIEKLERELKELEDERP